MVGHVGAPISAVVQLEPNVALPNITEALTKWLSELHGVALESAAHETLVVEWRTSNDDAFACQLVVSDSGDQARRTVTVLGDVAGVVAILEEAPLAGVDAPHAIVDLSRSIRLLLDKLMPIAQNVLTLKRREQNQFGAVEPYELIAALQEELTPGLVVAVTADDEIAPSSAQQALLDDLRGLAIVGWASVRAKFLKEMCGSATPRVGSIVSIARTSSGLDVCLIASTSLRTKLGIRTPSHCSTTAVGTNPFQP